MIDSERLAREAGMKVGTNLSGLRLVGFPFGESIAHLTTEDLQRFAALVRNEVLEEAAETCDGVYHQNIGPSHGEVRYGIAACSSAIRALKEKE